MQNKLSLTKIIEEIDGIEKGESSQDLGFYARIRKRLSETESRYLRLSGASGLLGGTALTASMLGISGDSALTAQTISYLMYLGLFGIALCAGAFAVSGVYFDLKYQLDTALKNPRGNS